MTAKTTDVSRRMRDLLARPDSYPHRPADVSVRETHISWVFLAGDRAYKLKKPLVLDFVDYGSPDRRRDMCREEVRLNRRLAPAIYLGVRGIAFEGERLQFLADNDPHALDYLVEMRRYDEGATLASRLARGELNQRQILAVGRALADFHEAAPSILDVEVPVLAVERRFDENVHELLGRIEQRSEIERSQSLERFAHAFVTRHAEALQRRAAGGSVREGHGDLRAEHVLVDGDVEVVDCLEFDPALRRLDVAEDLAFLVLDLVAQGAERLSEVLVGAYRNAGGDPGEDQLISFYAAYRALVRAKVELIRGAQLAPGTSARGRTSALARDLIALAERFAWRARLPLVLVVCGLPASGKSHLARALADVSRLPHMSSDVTRKQLARTAITPGAAPELYAPEWNALTYGELARRAADAVATAGGAIVDATFRHLADRRTFAQAFASAAPLVFIECQAPRPVLVRRARTRAREPGGTSDADADVVRQEFGSWEPLDEIPPGGHLVLRTDRPTPQIVGDVMALLDRRLMSAR